MTKTNDTPAKRALDEVTNQIYHSDSGDIYNGAILSSDGLHIIFTQEDVQTIIIALKMLDAVESGRLEINIAHHEWQSGFNNCLDQLKEIADAE